MPTDGFSTADAVLTSAMSGGFGGNRGNGQWGNQGGGMMYPGNSMLAAGAHADGTAIKEGIDCNATRVSDGLVNIGSQFENGARQSQIDSVNRSVSDAEFRSSDRFAGLTKDIADAEFRGLDRQRDIERLINQNAKDAAACCCASELAACKAHAELMASILKENSATRELITGTALSAANAKIVQLETINALGHRHHG